MRSCRVHVVDTAGRLVAGARPAWYNRAMNKVLENVLREVDRLPEEEQRRIARVLEEEVHKARRTPAKQGRWARLAERLSRESPLEGKSEEFLKQVREFRDGFLFIEPKNVD